MLLKKLTLMTICGTVLLLATSQRSEACCLFNWFGCGQPTTCCFTPAPCCPSPCASCCPTSSCGSCSSCGGGGCSSCSGGSCSSCGSAYVAPAGQYAYSYGTHYAPAGYYAQSGWGRPAVIVQQYPVARPMASGFFGNWNARPVAQTVAAPVQTVQQRPAIQHVDRRATWEPVPSMN
jgi:hypothetical protein